MERVWKISSRHYIRTFRRCEIALTKTVQLASLFPIATVAAGVVVASPPFLCPTNFTAKFYIDWAPIAVTATPTATEWMIQSSEIDTADVWTTIYSRFTLDVVPNNPNVSTAAAASNTIIVSANTGLANGQIVFFYQSGTIANSEWHYLSDISGTTFHTLDNLVNAQTGTANLFNQAWKESIDLPLNAVTRYRFVVNNNRGTNRNMVFRCNHTTLDTVTGS